FYRSHYDYRKTIMDISDAMISLFEPVLIHKTLVGSVVNEMFLENGCLLLRDADRGVYRVSTRESGNDPMGRDSLEGDDAVLQAVTEKEDVLFRFEAELDPALASRREELLQGFHDFRSEMMIPLKYKDELRGIVSLGRKKSGKMFTSEDLDLLRTIINQSAVALENARLFEENLEKGRMEEELKIAHDLQVSMLPKEPPRLDGIQVAASSVSAREVGGDFYDFITLNQGQNSARLGVIVADVSGKAVSGALVMAASRSIFRMLAEETQPVHHMMKTANLRLKQDIKQGMFVALSYGVIDPVEKTLTISSAGQTLPIIASRSSSECRIVELEGDRFPLGIVRECDYRETLVNLGSDDQIIFYTDGVVEALGPRDEMYGFERLMAVINRSRNLSAPELHDAILRDVMEFTGDVEPHDDITVVVVKIL
ncbi:MAG: SpoIIE family protein phosphatase, partial [bacterium]